MKKVLEAELVTMAHRILRMKDKDVDHLLLNAKSLYEKLLILKFYQDNFELGLIQNVSEEQLEDKLESYQDLSTQIGVVDTPARHQMPEDLLEQDYPLVVESEKEKDINVCDLSVIEGVEKIAPEIPEQEFENIPVEYLIHPNSGPVIESESIISEQQDQVFDFLDQLHTQELVENQQIDQQETIELQEKPTTEDEPTTEAESESFESHELIVDSDNALTPQELQDLEILAELAREDEERARLKEIQDRSQSIDSSLVNTPLVDQEDSIELGSEELTEDSIELGSEELTEASIEMGSEELTEDSIELGTEELTEDSIELGTEELTEDSIEMGSEELTEASIERDNEELTEASIELGTEELTEASIERDNEELTEDSKVWENQEESILDAQKNNQQETIQKREIDPFIGFSFMDLDFQRVDSNEDKKESIDSNENEKVLEDSLHAETEKKTSEVEQNTLFNLESTSVRQPHVSKAKSINDIYNTVITVGLNDRIAFEKNLFGGSSEDFNRVLSQLNTVSTYEEALSLIDHLVKPEYNNWEGKQEYEERFMHIVEKRFI